MGIPASFYRHLRIIAKLERSTPSTPVLIPFPNSCTCQIRSEIKFTHDFQSIEFIACPIPLNLFHVRSDQGFSSRARDSNSLSSCSTHVLSMHLCRQIIVPSQEHWEKLENAVIISAFGGGDRQIKWVRRK